MKTTWVHQHMNGLKQVMHIHNGILLDLKKENFITGDNMAGPRSQC